MIVPVAISQNKSPVIHVSHNICLESWCVKYVYSYAYERLLELRKTVARMKLLGDQSKNIKRLLLGVQLINPDVSTFWNMRRELLIEHFLNVNNEFKVTKLILSYKSKSNEAFAYRKWLLKRVLLNEIHDKVAVDNLMNEELNVCNMTSEKCQSNYHAWCHRIWCLENILPACSNDRFVLLHELVYSEKWISTHVSEHTGFHYRQYIINRLMRIDQLTLELKYTASIDKLFDVKKFTKPQEILIHIFGVTEHMWNEINVSLISNRLSLLLYELLLNDDLNSLFIDHESIWYHRRYVLYNLLSLICSCFGVHSGIDCNITNHNSGCNIVDSAVVNCAPKERLDLRAEKYPKMLNCDVNIIRSSNLYKVLMSNERSLLSSKFAKKSKDGNYDFAKRHEKWLRFILGISEL